MYSFLVLTFFPCNKATPTGALSLTSKYCSFHYPHLLNLFCIPLLNLLIFTVIMHICKRVDKEMLTSYQSLTPSLKGALTL